MSEQRADLSQKLSLRSYRPGDEDNIVDFLNLCYPRGWGDIKKWKWHYVDYPSFEKDNVFIFEADGKIVGFRGLFFRDLLIPSVGRTWTTSFGDTAVHPDFRRFGIYSRLHQATLEAAKSHKACMVFTWNEKGTVTYEHNKKTGFAEIMRGAYYWKILNYERVFKKEFRDLIRGNEEISSLVKGLESGLYLGVGDSLFPVAEILGEELQLAKARKKVKIIFDESAFPLMSKFRQGGKLQKVTSLFLLLLSRRMKIRVTSLGIVLKLAWRGVRIVV
jgi:GNAT superfamily N-acetyltransferase